jgi:SAM-dependent methyltransferase
VTDERTRQTAEHYSARARGFDEHWAPILRVMSRRVLPALLLGTARAVLDVGTGTGGMLPPLRAAAPSAALFGVDVAEGMLALAAEKSGGARLVVGDAHALPLLSGCADVALLAFVLHRVADPAQALAETARCLRLGGRVATVTWGPARFATPVGTLWHDELARAGGNDDQRRAVDHHGLVDAPEKVAALMARAGLSTERAWSEAYSERRDVDATMVDLTWDEDRLAALQPLARAALLRRVRARLEALAPDDLTFRASVVYAVGRKPR